MYVKQKYCLLIVLDTVWLIFSTLPIGKKLSSCVSPPMKLELYCFCLKMNRKATKQITSGIVMCKLLRSLNSILLLKHTL